MNSTQQRDVALVMAEALAGSELVFERASYVGGNAQWGPLTGPQWNDLCCAMLGAALKKGLRITVRREQ